MSLSRTEARDEMMGVARDALVSYDAGFIAVWLDDDSSKPPKGRQPWAEVGVYHISGGQVTLGGVGGRTFRRYGYLEVLVYTPENDGLTLADNLATIVQDALEGVTTPGGVIFRNVRATENGKSGTSRVTAISADFEYDQVK